MPECVLNQVESSPDLVAFILEALTAMGLAGAGFLEALATLGALALMFLAETSSAFFLETAAYGFNCSILRMFLGLGLAPRVVETIQLLESCLGPDAEPSNMAATWGKLEPVEVVHLNRVNSRYVPESLGHG